jgi:hypothetical protein
VESGENSTTEFPTLSTALGNPAQDAGFPPFHRAGGEVPPERDRRRKHEAKTEFHLTDPGHFEHDGFTSVASLRS